MLVATPAGGPAITPAEAGTPLVEGLPSDLGINQVQMIGSHNSYHQEPRPYLMQQLLGASDDAQQLEYTHASLTEQLGTMSVRQLELDVFADESGGLYNDPLLGPGSFEAPPDPDPYDPSTAAMNEPGFKVLHIQDVDYETTCQTLVLCLEEVDAWSDANPGHLPVAILIEGKDDPVPPEYPALPWTVPEPIDAAALDALDAEIRSVFDESELLTPDDVQGDAPTLNDAVVGDGWPTTGETQGQVLFLLDNEGTMASTYSEGHTSLEGRVMFTPSPVGTDTSAFVKRNDPEGANTAQIQQLVEDGYLVRTRADAPTFQARSGDTTQQDAAFTSGAQLVSTDYPVPGIATRFGTAYFAALPGFFPGRCNPVNTDGCADPEGCLSPFLDVAADHPFLEEICGLAQLRVTGGFTDRTFRPAASVTRQAMAAFLFRQLGGEVPGDCTEQFSDVPEEHPFFEEVCWLADSGITGGFSDGTFRPGATVTRQAMAAFLHRAAGSPPPSGCTPPQFSDVPASHPFFDEVCWLATSGVAGGFPNGTYRPAAIVTRQAMAAFLTRFAALD